MNGKINRPPTPAFVKLLQDSTQTLRRCKYVVGTSPGACESFCAALMSTFHAQYKPEEPYLYRQRIRFLTRAAGSAGRFEAELSHTPKSFQLT